MKDPGIEVIVEVAVEVAVEMGIETEGVIGIMYNIIKEMMMDGPRLSVKIEKEQTITKIIPMNNSMNNSDE